MLTQCLFKVTGYRSRCVPIPRARASASFRSSNPNTANVGFIYARALIIIAIYNACKCRVQSSGKTKTVLIAAVLAINEVNMSQPAIINQPSSTGRKERKAKERKLR